MLRPLGYTNTWRCPDGKVVLSIRYNGQERKKLIVYEDPKTLEPSMEEVKAWSLPIWGKLLEDRFEYVHNLDLFALDGHLHQVDAEDLVDLRKVNQ